MDLGTVPVPVQIRTVLTFRHTPTPRRLNSTLAIVGVCFSQTNAIETEEENNEEEKRKEEKRKEKEVKNKGNENKKKTGNNDKKNERRLINRKMSRRQKLHNLKQASQKTKTS
jgi:hypothetical protein